jgi:hypothetical protein
METEGHRREMTATQVFENTCKSFVFIALNQFRNRQVESSTLSLGSTPYFVVPLQHLSCKIFSAVKEPGSRLISSTRSAKLDSPLLALLSRFRSSALGS